MIAADQGVAQGDRRLRAVLLDDQSWEAMGGERRRDLRAAMDDLLADHRFDLPGKEPLRLLVTDGPAEVVLDLVDAAGRLAARAVVRIAELQPTLRDYLTTCQRLATPTVASAGHTDHLEALDIEKRLLHDEGARALAALSRTLAADHATARRLFTLLVALRYDTTRLGRLPLD